MHWRGDDTQLISVGNLADSEGGEGALASRTALGDVSGDASSPRERVLNP